MKKIYVEHDYDGLYGRFWENLGEVSQDRREFLSHPERFDLVCFTGGEDVSPELYGHRNIQSGCSMARDEREMSVFNLAVKHDIGMSGICRGSQFLNVMCGGTIVQHLSQSHGGARHGCITQDGSLFEVTSSHHQMSVLHEEGILLAWAARSVPVSSLVYEGNPRMNLRWMGSLLEADDEALVTEAFAYPKRRIFACQFHPEWQGIDEEAPQWTLRKIREICFGEGELTLKIA